MVMLGQPMVDNSALSWVFRHVFFGVDGADRALRNTYRTVDALVWVDGEKVWAFAETVDRTNVHTVGVLTLDTGFGDNVRHDNSIDG